MNTTAIHPAFATDYARAQAVEAARRAEDIKRARAFSTNDVPTTGTTPPETGSAHGWAGRGWRLPGFRAGAVAR